MATYPFIVVGGPCDGDTINLPADWDGLAHRPQPWVRLQPREPLLLRSCEEVNKTGPVTSVIYHLWVWQNGSRRWFEYRPEKPGG